MLLNVLSRPAFISLFLLTFSGCVAPDNRPIVVKPGVDLQPGHVETERVSAKTYIPFFYEQGHHLEELIEDGNWQDALDLYIEQQPFFTREKSKYWYEDALAALVSHLNIQYEGAIAEELAYLKENGWPRPRSQWKEFRDHFDRARRTLTSYHAHPLMQIPENRSPEADALSILLTDLEQRLAENLAETFANYDFHAEGDFFEIYPLSTPARALIAEARPALNERFSYARSADIEAFAVRYPIGLSGAALWRDLERWFQDAKARELRQKAIDPTSLLGRLQIAIAASKAGFNVPEGERLHLGFADATSRSLLQSKQIDFAPDIQIDLPVVWHKGPIETFTGQIPKQKVDFIIALDVVIATARREVKGLTNIKSRYINEYETVDNPAYEIARMELANALTETKETRLNNLINAVNPMALISAASPSLTSGTLSDRVAQAKRVFVNTPRTVKVPITKPYSYEKAQIVASKSLSANAYVINLATDMMYKGDFEIFEKRPFQIAYRVDPSDPQHARIEASHHQERDVSHWERQPTVIKLSSLLSDYLANQATNERPVKNLAAFFSDLRAEQTLAYLAYRENVHDDRPLDDQRFDSVLTLYHGEGGMAAGFYVTPNMVLTNWHVVNGRDYVELGRYDGQITYGRVLARDPGLDLALIKVQDRGRPVRLYSGSNLSPGQGIDVIGHPHRAQFSITRGVIGKIKKMTVNTETGAGGPEDVYFIQSDAATNPGNSGGPVFIGDRVVGVHSRGISKQIGEGLGYSVHYAHIRSFMQNHLAAPLPTPSSELN